MGVELRGLNPTNPYGGFFAAQSWYWKAYVKLVKSINMFDQTELQRLEPKENSETNTFNKERVRELVTALRKLDSPSFQFSTTCDDGSKLTVGRYQLMLFIVFLEASGGFWIQIGNTYGLYGEQDPYDGTVDPSTRSWFF